MATATKAASPKQKIVLDALSGGRLVKVTEENGKKKVTLTTAKGGEVKNAPKLDREAVEACIKHGWVGGTGEITEAGKTAKKPAKKKATASK